MGLHTALPEDLNEFDVIVAGGGTAGCVVASRLSDADPNLSILVIERGPSNLNDPTVALPMLWASHFFKNKHSKPVQAKNESQLGGRAVSILQGATLGGTSSINMSMYTRGQGCDYDDWKSPGWSAKELLPYFKKIETYHGARDREEHGYDGPVQVSSGPFRSSELERDFITAMNQVGYPEADDLQNFQNNNAVAHSRRTITPEGLRSDTASAYLHPRLNDGKHPNLHVLVETRVVRAVLDPDTKKATGVEYQPIPHSDGGGAEAHNPTATTSSPEAAAPPSSRIAKAKRLVIISCGALGTPLVLERSGVGDSSILSSAGVSPLVSHLPGVGRNLQDHHLTLFSYRGAMKPEDTFDDIHSGKANVVEMIGRKEKILSWNGYDVSAKIRPTEAEVDELGPEFRARWDRDFKSEPRRPLVGSIFGSGMLNSIWPRPEGQYFSIANYTCYPYSRGHIHITGSGLDDPIDFETGYLTDDQDIDLRTHIWAYKKQREVARRMKLRLGYVGGNCVPDFPEDSGASYTYDEERDESTGELRELKYSAQDDAIIWEWVKKNLNTCWHVLGTCKMVATADDSDPDAVVDERLNVRGGVRGLKVVDLSIAPLNVASNTCNTATVIGERAADICIEDLGLL